MSIKIIKEREPKESITYSLEFDYKDDPSGGFTFPCNRQGEILKDKMPQTAIDNYHKCLKDNRLTSPYIRTYKNHWVEPAVGECVCGEEIVLENQYMGACQCPRCGQWYNIYGQSLIPPEYWEDDEY